MADEPQKQTWSQKFIANCLATGALLALFFGAGALDIDPEVTKEAFFWLFGITGVFQGAKGVQDYVRARNGR